MGKKKVLIVTQEMEPFTVLSNLSKIASDVSQAIHGKSMELRILMPKFGTINERRHRLHEVVRLSGMNIIVNDDDYPLIIKVASLPKARIQVYFLDNEDFFYRKYIFEDKDEKAFEDNVERMVFFNKGVLETIKKFGWAPDAVLCFGWMTSLIPAFLKTVYKNEPLFQDASSIFFHQDDENINVDKSFIKKASVNDLDDSELDAYKDGDGYNLVKGAIHFSKGFVNCSDDLSDVLKIALEENNIEPIDYNTDQMSETVSYINGLIEESEEETK